MTLYKRGSVWWTYVTVRGVRHAKSTETNNRRLAEQVDNDFKQELTVRRLIAPQLDPEMTFEALAARFLANSTPKAYHLDRLRVLLPYFGSMPIGTIRRHTADEYRKWRHLQRKLTDTTINRDLECLRHILFWALDEGLLPANPVARVRMVRERRKRRSVMSLEEEARVLQVASKHLRPIVIAALDSGMRRGELLTERWEDVDFARRLLYVTHSKTAEGEAREIPLTGRLFDLLWESRENEGLIFTYKGKPISKIRRSWGTALAKAGVRHYRFHDLRHTFNTRLMEAGVMQEVRKALMGHSSGEDVNSIYTHVELPAKREAIRKLEAWIVEQTETQRERKEANG
ncbi:MAG: tyrosine-type recombinase/integrase [Chloroflexota bacterium]|nr:tyrosine-type recombinase/integrase [Chloroflexota bacterium]